MEEFPVATGAKRRLQAHFEQLISDGPEAGNLEARLDLLQAIRATSVQDSGLLDRLMLGTIFDQRRSLQETLKNQQQLRAMFEKMSAPPWQPAWFRQTVAAQGRPRALVHCNGGARLVEFGEGVDPASLGRGASVFLNQEQNVVMADAPGDLMRCGETAFYDRKIADGRLVLKHRDEEMIVDASDSLDPDSLSPGDELRWDRGACLAFERVESGAGKKYRVDEVTDVGRESVGGQDGALEKLLNALTVKLVAPELAKSYEVGGRRSILLCGPAGCGKTSMARVAASEVSRLSGRHCQFFVVKPGEWESPWVGEAQANIRKCFQALSQAASEAMAVLFLDDVESVGRHRGGSVSHHADKFTAAWLAELDGFADRGEVAIVSATNRKDLIDPALLERLSDVEITVPRPDSRGAERIFEIHLNEKIPVHPDGAAAAETRREIIETAVSRLYAPNGEDALCVLYFRDGKARPVSARELVSGRLIEQICRSARQEAFVRHLSGGAAGVRVADMEKAASEAIQRLSTTLTLHNAREHLDDLPQDVDVVRVETSRRRVMRPIRYLNTE
jgi:ATP-dependent 26S proteasome regulatory subunit